MRGITALSTAMADVAPRAQRIACAVSLTQSCHFLFLLHGIQCLFSMFSVLRFQCTNFQEHNPYMESQMVALSKQQYQVSKMFRC